jgi:hypothetical protein
MLIYNIMVAAYAISLFMSVLAIYISHTDEVTYQLYRVKILTLDVLTLLIGLIASFYV